MITKIRNAKTLIKILFIICRIYFLKDAKSQGNYLTKKLQILGPSFIKLGQTLSVRPDLVGEEIAQSLSMLQDNLPAFNTKIAINLIEKELGKPINEIFSFFSNKPVAAASIAQVHQAITIEEQTVAVKILRPNIEKNFAKDIKLFYAVAKFIDRFGTLKRLKALEVVLVFENMIKRELDLRIEAASASKLKENCQDDPNIHVPKIYWPYTSNRILTMEWVEGINISDYESIIKAGHDPKKLASNLCVSFFNQTYRDGFFHADIHPGNLFINAKSQIVPVDFGIMGILDKDTRVFVAKILYGFICGDYDYVAKVHFSAGYVPNNQSIDDFALACRAIGEPIIGMPVNKISIAKLLTLLFKISRDFKMETQPQLLLLQKTMVLIEGLTTRLDSEVNLWQEFEPLARDWANKNMGWKNSLQDFAEDLHQLISNLPEIILSIHQNGLKLHPETIEKIFAKK